MSAESLLASMVAGILAGAAVMLLVAWVIDRKDQRRHYQRMKQSADRKLAVQTLERGDD